MSYEGFKKAVQDALEGAAVPLTWSEVQEQAGFRQKVPNNRWVRRMEADISLVRERRRDGKMTWRLVK